MSEPGLLILECHIVGHTFAGSTEKDLRPLWWSMHVFLEPKWYQLLVRTINAIVLHPRRRSKFKLCAADGYSREEWLRATVANCYIRFPSRGSIMLYLSPPPCPFQWALSGWSVGWVLYLFCRLKSNLIGVLRLLPFHCIPAAYACRAPMPLSVDEAEIHIHNGQMIYNYLC